MATLDIEGQHVNVDDSFLSLPHDQQQSTVDEIASSLKAKPAPGVGEDLANVAKSAPGRILGGVAGLPGDLYHMGLRALGDNLTPESNYGSNAIMKSLGSDYKAQSEPGRLAQKGLDLAPALIGGPEALGAKLLTRVAAPAVASEVGGAMGGPVGELAGALGGAAGATAAARKFQAMAAARNAAPALTADKVLETAGKQFNDARDMNVVVKPDFATNAAADMRDAIKSHDPNVVKDVHAAADRLENLAGSGKGMPTAVAMNDTENIRKQLVDLKTSTEPSVRDAARKAVKSLQASQMALTPADALSGDAGAYRNLVSDAVGNWAKGKQAQTVLGKIGNAELASATAGSGANQDNNMRQAMKQLARNANNTNLPIWKKLGFSDQAGAAIDQAARGTTLGNLARGIGKGAPTGIVSAAGGLGIGHMAGGPVGAVALPAVGYIAKKIGDLSTKRAANAITSLVLSESPLAAQVAAQLPPQIIKQMPAKAQRILQGLAAQPVQKVSAPAPVAPATPAPPVPSAGFFPIPRQAPPIFAPPKAIPKEVPPLPTIPSAPVTAAADGQPSRPSRVGLGDNIRLGKYQDWKDGRIVKVGFVDGLKVHGVVPPIYNGDAPGFILTKGENVYRVTPHRGMEKLSSADGAQALKDAKKQQ